jgi:hypothetical protein
LNVQEIKTRKIDSLLLEYPFVTAYFNDNHLPLEKSNPPGGIFFPVR